MCKRPIDRYIFREIGRFPRCSFREMREFWIIYIYVFTLQNRLRMPRCVQFRRLIRWRSIQSTTYSSLLYCCPSWIMTVLRVSFIPHTESRLFVCSAWHRQLMTITLVTVSSQFFSVRPAVYFPKSTLEFIRFPWKLGWFGLVSHKVCIRLARN